MVGAVGVVVFVIVVVVRAGVGGFVVVHGLVVGVGVGVIVVWWLSVVLLVVLRWYWWCSRCCWSFCRCGSGVVCVVVACGVVGFGVPLLFSFVLFCLVSC